MKIIAITSCPVGMAHTYMASAALKKAAQKLGHEIKVETQGSMGIRDKITPEEVAEADLFISSADVAAIESERFDNIHTYETSTAIVIRKGEQVIKEAIASMGDNNNDSQGNNVSNNDNNNKKDEGEKNEKKRWFFWRR